MIRLSRILAVFLLTLGLGLAGCDAMQPTTEEAPSEARSGDVIPGRYIVVLDDAAAGKNAAEIDATLDALTQFDGVRAAHVYRSAVHGFAGEVSSEALSRLRDDPRVKFIEPDRIMTLGKPPWAGGGDDGGSTGQTTPWGITRVGGPGSSTPSARAFVIDSGIDGAHADLSVDASCSANFVTRGKDSWTDGNGHGTHVAGTIAAIDNTQDVVGVAPGATLCAVRVLDNGGSGAYSWVIAGVDFVAANAQSGDVANMSLGGPVSDALDAAVEAAADAGVRFALAAGNDGADASNSSPARVNHANVYTVAATSSNDCLTSWSNYGDPVDVSAPGSGIESTAKGGGTTTMSGTSMASPHVAGLLLYGNLGGFSNNCGGSNPYDIPSL